MEREPDFLWDDAVACVCAFAWVYFAFVGFFHLSGGVLLLSFFSESSWLPAPVSCLLLSWMSGHWQLPVGMSCSDSCQLSLVKWGFLFSQYHQRTADTGFVRWGVWESFRSRHQWKREPVWGRAKFSNGLSSRTSTVRLRWPGAGRADFQSRYRSIRANTQRTF